MKGKIVVAAVLLGLVVSNDLLACGNKFLVTSRGTRFGKAPVVREEASILVYANPDSTMPQSMAKVPIEEVLTEAGYQPTVVASRGEFEQALSADEWDLVLADLNDSAAIQAEMGDEAPMVVPVLYEPTKSAMQQAKQDYESVIKAPVGSQRFLESIDEAVAMSGE